MDDFFADVLDARSCLVAIGEVDRQLAVRIARRVPVRPPLLVINQAQSGKVAAASAVAVAVAVSSGWDEKLQVLNELRGVEREVATLRHTAVDN